jgi:hypothetical protein
VLNALRHHWFIIYHNKGSSCVNNGAQRLAASLVHHLPSGKGECKLFRVLNALRHHWFIIAGAETFA